MLASENSDAAEQIDLGVVSRRAGGVGWRRGGGNAVRNRSNRVFTRRIPIFRILCSLDIVADPTCSARDEGHAKRVRSK